MSVAQSFLSCIQRLGTKEQFCPPVPMQVLVLLVLHYFCKTAVEDLEVTKQLYLPVPVALAYKGRYVTWCFTNHCGYIEHSHVTKLDVPVPVQDLGTTEQFYSSVPLQHLHVTKQLHIPVPVQDLDATEQRYMPAPEQHKKSAHH